MRLWKFLYPGLGVKRWVLFMAFGLLALILGIAILTGFHLIEFIENLLLRVLTTFPDTFFNGLNASLGIMLIISGMIFVYWSIKGMLLYGDNNSSHKKVVDDLLKKKQLERGPKVVALGGGTGLSNLLRGIKEYTSNITAIVTVADDGGSSGKLRDELGMLPPGDIRNCLVALADTEPLMEQLFQYRFSSEGHLVGHSFGNLFIASLTEVTGDFEEAIRESSKVLAVRGKVLPATNRDVQLGAVYNDHSIVMGESAIPQPGKKIEKVFIKPEDCQPTPEALQAIEEADIILIGPGSLYTSIIPNLLVKGIPEAIKNSKARKIYVCNVMTQPGETDGYTVSDHIRAIFKHSLPYLFDHVIINKEESAEDIAIRYEEEGAFPVKLDREKISELSVNIVADDLLTDEGYIRHDPRALARVIFSIAKGR